MPEPMNLTNRFSIIYLKQIDTLAIYKDKTKIIFEGPLANIHIAKDILANQYLLDKDDLDQSYNQTMNELNNLESKGEN